jgi:hypothetical protein
MQCAPSRPLSGLQRFVPATAAALFVSIGLISPCQAGPEFTAFSAVNASASGHSADKRSAPSSASMQTFGTLVSAKPANQPLYRSYAASVDLGTGDLSAGAIRSMPISSQSPRAPR